MSEHDQQGDSPKPDDDDYKVGYGRPPKQHQFKKGQSGNPKGGSRKKPRCFDESRLDDLLQQEAARKVTINGEVITADKAVMRSILLNAIKGKVTPQRLVVQLLDKQEQREKARKLDLAEKAIEYVQHWGPETKRLEEQGLPAPELPFHPDDVHLNGFTGEVRVIKTEPSKRGAKFDRYLEKLRAERDNSTPSADPGCLLEPGTQSASAGDGNTSLLHLKGSLGPP